LVLPDADDALESRSDKMRSADSLKSRLLAGLGVLNISKCGLTSLQGLAEVDGLEVLYASDNSLTNLAFTGTLSALREMHVQNNSIASLRGLSMLPRIQRFHYLAIPFHATNTIASWWFCAPDVACSSLMTRVSL